MRVWGDKEALWGRGWAGEMHCTVVRSVAWGWEMGWGQLGVPQTPPHYPQSCPKLSGWVHPMWPPPASRGGSGIDVA